MLSDVPPERSRNRKVSARWPGNKQFTAALLDTVDTLILLLDREGRIVGFNRACERISGYTLEEAEGRSCWELLIPPDDLAGVLADFQSLCSGRFPSRHQNHWRMRDGRRRLISWSNTCLVDKAGYVEFVVATGQDITETVRIDSALRESELRQQVILNSIPDPAWLKDAQSRYLAINEAWGRFAGLKVTEVTGNTDYDLLPAEMAREFQIIDQQVMSSRDTIIQEQRVKVAEAGFRWYETIIAPMFGNQGQVVGTVGIARDITRRKHAEAESLQLSGRLLSLQDAERRRIARELHDSTAQCLAALALNLDLLSGAEPGLNAKAQGLLHAARTMTDQCTREIKTLSYLLHPPLLDELGLAGAVRDYVDGLAARSGIRIDLDLPAELGRLPKEAELALFRILQESLANVHRHAQSATASVRLHRDAEGVRLCIQDRGRGMALTARTSSAETLDGVLGVGILGMKERLRQLGGRLEIASDATGTTVTAILPENP